jgi:tetratricopeptide (TPR) repeat protein
MKAENIAYAIGGICFGLIVGAIGMRTYDESRLTAQPPAAAAAAPAPESQPQAETSAPQPRTLDEARVQQLTTILDSDPKNAGAMVQLGNTYFEAERFPEGIKWFEEALKVDPKNADASTGLGMGYYYTKSPDAALQQFQKSLQMDPRHAKTLLNQGIVLAFGKQDLNGAEASWRKLIEVAPGSPEAQAAQRGLEGIAAAQAGPRAGGAPTNQ